MTATKAQIIDFIIDNFEGPGKMPASKSKLESYKKSELEEFITQKASEAELNTWLAK